MSSVNDGTEAYRSASRRARALARRSARTTSVSFDFRCTSTRGARKTEE